MGGYCLRGCFLHLFDACNVSLAIGTASTLHLDRLILIRLFSRAPDLIMLRVEWQMMVMTRYT